MKNTCVSCRYWQGRAGYGECRKYPPVVVDAMDGVSTEWPAVATDDWCGEWEKRPEHICEGVLVHVYESGPYGFPVKSVKITKVTGNNESE
jgi:hypothetical protein